MKRNIAYILGIMLLAASCIGEQELDVNSTRKDEVKFAAEMKSVDTKTLYGADNANTIKVKWVNGDQIKVFGTHCAVPTGEYEISEATNQPNVDGSQEESIADELVRIGDVGVQWGTEQQSDFVAIYPAENSSFQYNEDNGAVTVSTTISSVQNYVFDDEVNSSKTIVVNVYDDNGNKVGTKSIPVWEGTHFANDATNPTMPNAIMYARTDGVTNGKNVALKFEPFTTVLKFRFEGFSDLWDKGTEVYIQSITVTAPDGEHIAGNFDITVPRGVSEDNPVTAVETGNNSNSITINTIKAGGSYLKITADQAVEFNVFTLPLPDMAISYSETNYWSVSIQVQGVAAPYVYKMKPTKDGGYELVPGLIHKVKIPALKITTPPVWTPGNWITQIPKPVYVSELSLPGAWYAGDLANYQNNASLTQLYNNGIRAFHIDCRMSPAAWTQGSGWLSGLEPSSDNILVCAGTDKISSLLGYISDATVGTTVLASLQEISKQIKDDEYIVVVLSICEKPLDASLGSIHSIYGSISPADVIPAITSMLNENGEALKVFGYYDHPTNTSIKTKGKTLTKDTAIEDVLGTMVVKINTNTTSLGSYTFPSSALVSFASMASNDDYVSGDITALSYDYFAKMQTATMQWGNADSDLTYYYHHAQKTRPVENANATSQNPIPTLKDRKAAIDNIIAKSKELYDKAEHDIWFQMGLGGYSSTNDNNKEAIASVLNAYLQEKIVAKMDTDPSPVGIVLMNNCLNYTDLVNDIIEMNGKFYLNRKGNDVITGGGEQNGDQNQGTETKASAYVGTDAF